LAITIRTQTQVRCL